MLTTDIAALFVRDAKRLVQEIEAFPDDDTLWRVCPGISNSAGNLALHLEGNLREFIGRQLGGIDYVRQRDLEFSTRDVPREEVLERIRPLSTMLGNVIAALTPETLDGIHPYKPLGTSMSSRQFLIHVYGHLSYHLGQIDYLRRFFTGHGAIDFAKIEP
jgi:hypothetical protein